MIFDRLDTRLVFVWRQIEEPIPRLDMGFSVTIIANTYTKSVHSTTPSVIFALRRALPLCLSAASAVIADVRACSLSLYRNCLLARRNLSQFISRPTTPLSSLPPPIYTTSRVDKGAYNLSALSSSLPLLPTASRSHDGGLLLVGWGSIWERKSGVCVDDGGGGYARAIFEFGGGGDGDSEADPSFIIIIIHRHTQQLSTIPLPKLGWW